MRYEDFRREYLAGGLSREMLNDCPVRQFEQWMEQALESQIEDPTAMVLATVDDSGAPWQRIVLLKGLSSAGFVFYTNFASAKAHQIGFESRVSLLFPWNALDRQVIVAGPAQKMTAAESADYFHSRPRDSQLVAWASHQSQPLAGRAELEAKVESIRDQFAGADIPMPNFWGGYVVRPERVEFWQGGAHRLHDRFRYTRQSDDSWSIEQLQP